MKKFVGLVCLLLFFMVGDGFAQIPAGYYYELLMTQAKY